MASSIDKRVVQMTFDNKSFENNAKQTMNTLSKLKSALSNLGSSNKALSGLDKAGKTTALDGIAKSVESLEKRFSTLGIIGMRVIQNLTDGLMGGLSKGLNYVNEGIVQGGIRRATNLENAHYQLQALLKDESKVQAVMDNASAAVDGTAYSFDEAAKAAAMFSASGIKAGEPMENALKGIVGTAAMTNAEFERISLIFTSVAGQGRLMGDQLLQLSSLGLNAPATIADYFNKIDDASTKASDEVRAAVKEISGGTKVTEGDIRDLVSEGQISFKIFAEAMYDAFGDSAEKANETFQGAMSNIKSALARIGAGFISPLIEQNSSVIGLINRVREKINEIKSALVFDEQIKNFDAYSKRFSDFVLSMADDMANFVENLDIASGMKVFYNVVDSIINVLKGLGSILAPIGKAFADVFLSFDVGQVIKATGSLKEFTAGLKLTESQSKNLHDAFEGVFNVVKTLASGFLGLLKAIFPIGDSVSSLGDVVLELVGAIGRGLTAFTEWISESKLVAAAFKLIKTASSTVWDGINDVIEVIVNLIRKASELKIVEKVVSAVGDAFNALGKIAKPAIDFVVDGIKSLVDWVGKLAEKAAGAGWDFLVSMFGKLKDAVSNFDATKFKASIDDILKGIKNLAGAGKGGFSDFVSNIKRFGENVKNALNFDKIIENLQNFKKIVQEFVGWFKDTMGSIFGNVSIGGLVASGGGVALIYSIIEIAKALKEATSKLDDIPKVLESVSGALQAYSSDLKADAVKKNSQAILALAAALAVLSFTDTDKALEASFALSIISGVLMAGTSQLLKAANSGKKMTSKLDEFGKGLGKAFNQLGKAAKWAAIGGAFKSMGEAVLMIAGSMIALGFMYKNNASELEAAETTVAIIASVMVGVMAVMTILNKKMKDGGSGFLKSAGGMALIAASLASVIRSLKKVMDIDLPRDYQTKMGMIEELLAEMAIITVALSLASKKAGGNKIKATPIIALAVSLKLMISSLSSLMDMDLPNDYGVKIGIMAGMFAGLGGLILAIGQASKNAGSALKGAATLIALAIDIGVITGALMILSIIPGDGLLKGAVALGGVLIALSSNLKSAASMSGKDTYKTVLSMAVTVAAIAASLGILSMISVEDLIPAAVALGSVLFVLSKNLAAAGTIANEGTWKPLVVMVASVVVIAGSLAALAAYPWESLLSSAVALGGVILAFTNAFQVVGSAGNMNLNSAASFLAMTLAVIPIGVALAQLAAQPWQGLLASAAGLSSTILAFTVAYQVVGRAGNMNLGAAASFLAMTLAVIPIGNALAQLAAQPWQGLLASAAALSGTILAFTAAFKIISASKPNLTAVVAFVAASLALIPISAALNMLAGQPWQSLLTAAVALGGVALGLSGAMAIMGAASSSIVGVIAFVAGAIALIPIAAVIQQLSGLSWQEVATGLITLAGGLAIIGVAGVAGVAIAPGLLALSAALIVFAAAIAAIGLAIPVFVNGIKTVFSALSDLNAFMGEAISGMVEAGKNLMQGLLQGIADGASAIFEGIKSVGKGIVDGIKGVLGIHSPSTVFAAIGENVDQGFVQGIAGGANGISVAMNTVFGGLAKQIDISEFNKKGQEAASGIENGLLAGQEGVKGTMNSVADPSGIDTSKYNQKGQEGGTGFQNGLAMAGPLINQTMSSMFDASGVDTSSFGRKGEESAKSAENGMSSGGSFMQQIMSSMFDATGIDTSSLTGKGSEGAKNLATGLESGSPMIQEIMGSMMDGSGIDVSSLMSLGSDGADSLGTGLESGSPMIQEIMNSMMDGSGVDISGMMKLGKEGSKGLDSGLKSGEGNVKNTMKSLTNVSGVDVSGYNKVGRSAAEAFGKGLTSGAKKEASSAGTTVANAFKSAIGSAVKGINLSGAGKSMADSITKGVKSGASGIKTAAQSAAKSAAEAVKSQQNAFRSAGSSSMNGFASGIKSKSGEVTNAVKSIVKKASNIGKSEIKQFQKIGTDISLAIAKGITSKASDASRAAKEVAEKAVQGLSSKVKSFQGPGKESANTFVKSLSSTLNSSLQSVINQMSQRGQQIAQGVANGINANTGIVRQAASSLARQIDQQIKSDLQIHSPSKLAQKRGEQVAEGLAKGLNGSTGKVKKATKVVTSIVKKELKGLKDELKDLYDKPFDPTGGIFGNALKNASKIGGAGAIVSGLNEQLTEWKNVKDSIKKVSKTFSKTGNGGLLISGLAEQMSEWVDAQNPIEIGEMLSKFDKVQNGWDSIGRALNNYMVATTGKDIYQTKKIRREKKYWKDLLATKQAGADKEKYMDMSMAEFKKTMQEEYEAIIDEYNQKIAQEKETVRGWYEPFKQVDMTSLKTREQVAEENYQAALKEAAAEDAREAAQKKAEKTSKSKKKVAEEETKVSQVQKENVTSLTQMQKQQSKAYKTYDKTYTSLAKKLKGENLWDYVKDMGVDSLQFLVELDQMSEKELKKNIKMYDDNLKLADNIAKKRSKEIAKETKKAVKDLFTVDGKAADKQAEKHLASLTEEERYWTKLLAIKQNGKEQEKYLEMDIKTFREETLTSAKDMMVNFNDQIESVKQNMRDSIGLFAEVSLTSEKTAEDLLASVHNREAAFTKYAAVMDSLSQKLAGTEVLKAIQNMGVDSVGVLEVVDSMTAEQLADLATSWDAGTEKADKAAQTGIDKVKETTTQGLADLFNVSADEINLDDFIEAFDGTLDSLEKVIMGLGTQVAAGKDLVVEETNTMMQETNSAVENGLETASTTAQQEGAKVGESLAEGIESGTASAVEAGTSVAEATSAAMATQTDAFQQVGNTEAQTYANGVSEKQPEAENAGTAIANSTIDGIASKNEAAGNAGTSLAINAATSIASCASAFFEVGANLGQGFVDGINSKVEAARAAAQALADAAKAATTKSLDIHSPSRVMEKFGQFTGIGFINGLMACVSKAALASEEITDEVTKGFDTGLSDIFTDDMFGNPVIRPEVDLTGVEQSVNDISRLFNNAIQIAAIDADEINLKLTNRQRRESDQSELQTGRRDEGESVTNWNFTQNNYSPKALSETDIYRQTKNQFSLFRTAVARA